MTNILLFTNDMDDALNCLIIICSGPWQVMLKQADGSYACIAESATRFTLGEVSS